MTIVTVQIAQGIDAVKILRGYCLICFVSSPHSLLQNLSFSFLGNNKILIYFVDFLWLEDC